ncbi:MAG: (3S)-malyl-CoA thioesterase, partial [Thermoleophilaceae bacterium]|nr:(3S)-malyl-CoA thioesterase [Thermoleophilaceae bacterium]
MPPAPDLTSLRSLLFAPGNDERKLTRALGGAADAVIADLEDSVPAAEKAHAREVTRDVLTKHPKSTAMIRVNAPGTREFVDDLALVERLRPAAVVLPKATPESVRELDPAGLPVLAIVETAIGVRLAFEIASAPHVFALMAGAVDLAAELGLEPRPDALEIHYLRSKLVIDSAAAGARPPFDVVHVAIDDADGLAEQGRLARSLGLRGKACIHPAQVEIVNEVFTPDAESV